MADRITDLKIICSGGLDSNRNYLDLSDRHPGIATNLVNFEPSLFGGYRRMSGFTELDATYPDVDDTLAEGKILGVVIYNDEIYAMRKLQSGTTYAVYKYDSGSGWTAQTTGLTHNTTSGGNTVNRINWLIYNFGDGDRLAWVDGVNNATLFDGTNWTQIDPGGTGADFANAGGGNALEAPKYIGLLFGHLFMSGDSTSPGVVAHSSPSRDYDWLTANGSGQLIPGFTTGNLKAWRDELYIFGTTDISKVYVTSSNTFALKDVTKNIGTVAQDAILEVAGDLIYLSRDGIRSIAGTDRIGDTEIETLSKRIQEDIRDLIATFNSDDITAVQVNSKTQARFFLATSSVDVTDSQGIIGGIRPGSDPGMGQHLGNEPLRWEWGKIRGIRCSVVCQGLINNQEYIIHGDHDGKVYRQEQGNNYNGANITAVYSTPYLDFGSPTYRKKLRKVDLFLRPEGLVELDVNLSYDWGAPNKVNPATYRFTNEAGDTSQFGDGSEYDDGSIYGSARFSVLKGNVEGTFESVQLTISTTDMQPSYSVQALIFEVTPTGRR